MVPPVQLSVEILPVEYATARERVFALGPFDVHLALGLAADRDVPVGALCDEPARGCGTRQLEYVAAGRVLTSQHRLPSRRRCLSAA